MKQFVRCIHLKCNQFGSVCVCVYISTELVAASAIVRLLQRVIVNAGSTKYIVMLQSLLQLATGLHGHLLCLTNAFQTLQTWSLSRCCSKEVPGLPGMRGKICNTVSIGRGLANICSSVTRAFISIGLLALSAHHCIGNPSKSLSKFPRTYIDTSWQDLCFSYC